MTITTELLNLLAGCRQVKRNQLTGLQIRLDLIRLGNLITAARKAQADRA
jgi:hypothetical protein